MDKQQKQQQPQQSAKDPNRTNQCNPTHTPSGPGHESGYHGTGTKTDLGNHSNQLNPNNKNFGGGQTNKNSQN
jgi:hypothetical protein